MVSFNCFFQNHDWDGNAVLRWSAFFAAYTLPSIIINPARENGTPEDGLSHKVSTGPHFPLPCLDNEYINQ